MFIWNHIYIYIYIYIYQGQGQGQGSLVVLSLSLSIPVKFFCFSLRGIGFSLDFKQTLLFGPFPTNFIYFFDPLSLSLSIFFSPNQVFLSVSLSLSLSLSLGCRFSIYFQKSICCWPHFLIFPILCWPILSFLQCTNIVNIHLPFYTFLLDDIEIFKSFIV